MSLPAALLVPIEEHGETVLGSLLTKGEYAFVSSDGRAVVRPIWALVTGSRCWLVAENGDETWAVAVGAGVKVEKGWTWDALRVGPWQIPLRNGTRKAAVALVEKFAGGGAAFPTPEHAPPPPGPPIVAAKGALDPPELSIPRAFDDERWLMALPTGSTHPFNSFTGSVAQEPVWIGVTDRRVIAWAAHGDESWVQVLDDVLDVEGGTRPRIVTGSLQFAGTLLSPKRARQAAALSECEPVARWALAAQQALSDHDANRAIKLWREAHALGKDSEIYNDVARMAYALDQPQMAVAVLAGRNLEPRVARWRKNLVVDRKAIAREGLLWAHFRAALTELLPSEIPEIPDGTPWPPEDPSEIWATALLLDEHDQEALSLWMGDSARALAGRAAIRAAADHPSAANAWIAAAQAARKVGDAAATEFLERAIALGAEAEARWTRGVWAWQDGKDATEWWDVPPDEGLDVAGYRAYAAFVAEGERWADVAAALAHVVRLDPTDRAARMERARLLEHELDDVTEALATLEAAARVVDEPGAALWWDVARMRAASGEGDPIAALTESIREDFLHPDVIRRALDCPGVALPDATKGWWLHLVRLLDGTADADGSALPAQKLSEARLDALHPGGTGWLDSVRHTLDSSEVPERGTLIRGLEKLEARRYAKAGAVLERVCDALGFYVPETYLYRGEGAWGASGWPTEPPVVLVGFDHLDDEDPRKLDDAGLAFLLGGELAHLKCQHPLMAFDAGLVGTSRSVYQTFGKYAGTAETVVDVVTLIPGIDQLSKIQTVIKLSRKVFAARSAVDKVTGVSEPVMGWLGLSTEEGSAGTAGREIEWQGAALQFRMQADRVGLLVCGDLRAAVDAILRSSTDSLAHADAVRDEGLAAVLAREEGGLAPSEALRITALLAFAVGLSTADDDSSP